MASGNSWLFFSYNGKLANKDPNHKELVILGIPCSPLSHNYYIEPIKGSVIREIFMPVHRFSDNVLLPSIGSQHYTQNL